MSLLGTRVVRVEDPALLTVGGKYVDDLAPEDAVYATFVRSAMAHAEITGIDISEAADLPGVDRGVHRGRSGTAGVAAVDADARSADAPLPAGRGPGSVRR